MDRDFWLERWENQQIGFHQPQGQPLLSEFWQTLGLATGARVLVPLCGKTPDLAWLAAQGHAVTGIEFSARAARDFFAEQGLAAVTERVGEFERYHAKAIDIWVGDFFAFSAERMARIDAVYDRAALIALPPKLRIAYTARLRESLPAGTQMLLITLDYDQREMAGPPFAVSEDEVHGLYGFDCDVVKLRERNALTPGDHLSTKGLSKAAEAVYRIRRR